MAGNEHVWWLVRDLQLILVYNICSQSQRSTETENESGDFLAEDPIVLLDDKHDEQGSSIDFTLNNNIR